MVVGTYTVFEASKNRRRLTSLALSANGRGRDACSISCYAPRLCPPELSRRVWPQGLVLLETQTYIWFDL